MPGIFRSTVNLQRWRGVQPNVLLSGRVDASVGVNNDKTGYSLTPGSYVTRKSSSQHVVASISVSSTTGNASISAVTLANAHGAGANFETSNGADNHLQGSCRGRLSSTTVWQGERFSSAGVGDVPGSIAEYF